MANNIAHALAKVEVKKLSILDQQELLGGLIEEMAAQLHTGSPWERYLDLVRRNYYTNTRPTDFPSLLFMELVKVMQERIGKEEVELFFRNRTKSSKRQCNGKVKIDEA